MGTVKFQDLKKKKFQDKAGDRSTFLFSDL